MVSIASIVVLFGVAVAAATSPCGSFNTCADCIGQGLFCGWCSPTATVFSNGTQGSQCQDQTLKGWHCNHLYSTDKCLPGYACNSTSGQCTITEAGQGDTKENCEKHCTKIVPPTGLSVCDVVAKKCKPCKDYCQNDQDCPGSYCNGGLCHGSSCEQETKCNSTCSADTPDAIVGTWRGVQIQGDFAMGEFDFKFQKRSAGPQVEFRGPTGAVSTGSLSSDSASGGSAVTLTYTAGPLKGSTYKGSYKGWEPSDFTEQFSFWFGEPNGNAPTDISQAMNSTGMTTYVLSRCKGKVGDVCDFSSVFPKAVRRELSMLEAFAQDPCKKNADCSACIGDSASPCGWCSTKVIYADGSAGSQCAGFDSTGKPLGWQCKGKFSREDCADHGCDWTNIKQPKCIVCDGPGCQLTAKECAKACVTPPSLFTCDKPTKKCIACNETDVYCTKNSDCLGSYCQISGAGPWSCHGAMPGGCSTKTACAAGCNSTEEMFMCDKYAGQCKPVSKSTPGAQSKWDCSHSCKAARPTGTWRGVEVSKTFMRGEWDVTFFDDNTLHWRAGDGSTFIASVAGANFTAAEQGAVAVSGVYTKGTSVGQTFEGVFRVDTQGDDGIAYLLTWGQGGAVKTFAEAMGQGSMFVMTGCNADNELCNYSKASVL